MFEEEYLQECESAQRLGLPKPNKKAFINGKLVLMKLDDFMAAMNRPQPPRQPAEEERPEEPQGRWPLGDPHDFIDSDIRKFILTAQDLLEAMADPNNGFYPRSSFNHNGKTRGKGKKSKSNDDGKSEAGTSAEGDEENKVEQPRKWGWFVQKLWNWASFSREDD